MKAIWTNTPAVEDMATRDAVWTVMGFSGPRRIMSSLAPKWEMHFYTVTVVAHFKLSKIDC